MNSKYKSLLGAVSSLMLTGTILLPAGASAQEAGAENVQVLTRGPVHEAFAESISYDPQPGLIISTQVPESIEELPPEQKPEGDNVTWISGYWAWDDDQNDFIWISGVWRNLPPGRQWVPGYWNAIEEGKYQWTSGYWADATTEEVSYVSTPPPRSVDSGPNVEAPSSDHSWIPGNWFWVENRYAWRPGYWVPLRTNWTWVPSRYCWTRRGYVYVDGYWDYAVARRGVLFAPVYFRDRYYDRPDYSYTPLIVVALNVFSNHLFVRPRYGQYYFGDYYAPRYQTSGFYTSYSWGATRGGYDPIYAYDRWENRDDRGWDRRRQEDYNYFRDNEDARPPSTWAAMRDYRTDRFSDGRNRTYATPLAAFTQDPVIQQSFSKLDQGARQKFVSQNKEMRKFSQERKQIETRNIPAGAEPGKAVAIREKTNRSPITGREASRFSEKEAPPKRPEARGNKTDMRPVTQEGPKGKPDREPKGNVPAPGENAASQGKGREEKPEKMDRENPSRGAEGSKKESPQQRESQQKTETGPTPDRKTQGEPSRESQPKPEVNKGPQREERTRPQPTPERKPEAAPKQERQPQQQPAPRPTERKEQQAPKREERTQPQPQPAPERKPQAAPKQERQPQQQPAPQPTQRREQQAPKREERKPQAAPQPAPQPQQATPQPPQRKEEQKGRGTEEEKDREKGRKR